jgi:hypothetical protein
MCYLQHMGNPRGLAYSAACVAEPELAAGPRAVPEPESGRDRRRIVGVGMRHESTVVQPRLVADHGLD